MKEFKVEYHKPPFGNGPRSPSIAIIEAETPEDAEALLRDAYTRHYRSEGQHLSVLRATAYQKPQVSGRVISF